MNRANAAIVLMRHGIDPAADVGTLMALLEVRGWQVTVDEVLTSGPQGRRYRAVGHHPPPPDKHPARGFPAHLQHSGRTAAEAVAAVLATVLERSERSDGRG